MNERFELWTAEHYLIMFGTFFAAAALIYAGRKGGDRTNFIIRFFLFLMLNINYIVYATYRISSGYWDIRYDLPMELCNWSTLVTVAALLTRNLTMAELSYFWVMTGSINGVITPDLQVRFGHIYYFIFFIGHSGLVITSLYIVFGMKLYPVKWAVPRAFLITQLYFISAMGLDLAIGANYGYMLRKPSGGSLMDYMGSWPYYILGLQAIAITAFSLIYLPFYFANRKKTAASV